MSRTIRRTTAKKHHSRFEKDYTHYYPEVWLDVLAPRGNWSNGIPFLPLEGKAFQIAYFRYHSDCGLSVFGWEEAYERPMKIPEKEKRLKFKAEMQKWLKDPEHEIQFVRFKQIYDLY